LLGPALIVVPGTILAFASWMIVSRLTRRSEVTGLLLRQVAREPHAGDLEEHQLGNIVAEMAIAAGIQPPKLRLVDAPPMNAVALGSGVDGATIVVTRGLLDALDRGETQAIIGHLIASIGNGDLRIAHYILTMYATVGLLERLPFTPIDPAMRARVRKVVRSARAGDATSDEDIGALALELYRSPGEDDGGSIETSDPFDLMKRPPKIGWVERLPKLPAQGIAMALFYVTMAQSMCASRCGLFVNPLLALLWRRRRVSPSFCCAACATRRLWPGRGEVVQSSHAATGRPVSGVPVSCLATAWRIGFRRELRRTEGHLPRPVAAESERARCASSPDGRTRSGGGPAPNGPNLRAATRRTRDPRAARGRALGVLLHHGVSCSRNFYLRRCPDGLLPAAARPAHPAARNHSLAAGKITSAVAL
jgi:hypothetical protein